MPEFRFDAQVFRSPVELALHAILLTAGASTLGAQVPLPERAGTTVRIETSTNRVFRGALLDGPRDSLRLRQDVRDSIIAVPLASVRTYSVLRTNRGRGARRGLVIGGGVALGIVGLLTAANSNEEAALEVGMLLALPATLLGGGIGAGVGASLATPEWSAPVALRASRRDGLSLQVGIRF